MNKIESTEFVTLVDKNGNALGYAEKLDAHLRGELHLAFSLMIIRKRESGFEYLLQRRALNKYHSGGLWANTCCSHPRPSESAEDAARRRVFEELGICDPLKLINIGQICYEYPLDNNMIEHEYDHIILAQVDNVDWQVNDDEAMDIRWWKESDITSSLKQQPSIFAAWFPDVFEHIKKQSTQPSSSSNRPVFSEMY